MTNLQQTENQVIPVYFNESDFDEFILPQLWVGSRGPKPKIALWKLFHYILHVLYTGKPTEPQESEPENANIS